MPEAANISIHIFGRAAETAAERLRVGSVLLIQGRVEIADLTRRP